MSVKDDYNKYLEETGIMGSTMDYTAWELETWDDSKEIDPAPTTTKTDVKLEHIPGLGIQEYTNMVHQPEHYKIFPDEEVINLIKKCLTPEEFKGYCKGNMLKYRLRDKENIIEDFEKSREYKRYLQELEAP